MINIHAEFKTEKEAKEYREAYYMNLESSMCSTETNITIIEKDGKWVADGWRSSSCD